MSDLTDRQLLEEQIRLMKKADRRSGCLWNLVMTILFSWLYLAWLGLKRLAKWLWTAIRLVWAVIRLASFFVAAACVATWQAMVRFSKWAWRKVTRR